MSADFQSNDLNLNLNLNLNVKPMPNLLGPRRNATCDVVDHQWNGTARQKPTAGRSKTDDERRRAPTAAAATHLRIYRRTLTDCLLFLAASLQQQLLAGAGHRLYRVPSPLCNCISGSWMHGRKQIHHPSETGRDPTAHTDCLPRIHV